MSYHGNRLQHIPYPHLSSKYEVLTEIKIRRGGHPTTMGAFLLLPFYLVAPIPTSRLKSSHSKCELRKHIAQRPLTILESKVSYFDHLYYMFCRTDLTGMTS